MGTVGVKVVYVNSLLNSHHWVSLKGVQDVYDEELFLSLQDERNGEALGAVNNSLCPLPLGNLAKSHCHQTFTLGVRVYLTTFPCNYQRVVSTLIAKNLLLFHEHVQGVNKRDPATLIATSRGLAVIQPGGHLSLVQSAQLGPLDQEETLFKIRIYLVIRVDALDSEGEVWWTISIQRSCNPTLFQGPVQMLLQISGVDADWTSSNLGLSHPLLNGLHCLGDLHSRLVVRLLVGGSLHVILLEFPGGSRRKLIHVGVGDSR